MTDARARAENDLLLDPLSGKSDLPVQLLGATV